MRRSYDATIEPPAIEALRQKIRTAIAAKKTHTLVGRMSSLMTEAGDSATGKSQVAFLLEQHAKWCAQCTPEQRRNDLVRATAMYRALLREDPQYGPALLALARQKSGADYERAMKEVIEKTGDNAYFAMLGHHYREQENFSAAEKAYRQALPAIPAHYGIMYALAALYAEQGDWGRARRYARFALRRLQRMDRYYRDDPVTKQFYDELRRLQKKNGSG